MFRSHEHTRPRQLSRHFTLAELTVTEVRQYQRENSEPSAEVIENLRALARFLECVRSICGDYPVLVHSGYRCQALNAHIGGAKNSQHIRGEAADIHFIGGDLREAFDLLRASELKFGQLILEDGDGDGTPTWIHISLGHPWRARERSGQVLTFDGRTYTRIS